jgi:hypothetical protein
MANTERIRMAGVACAVGGALWVITLIPGVVAPQAVYGSVTSYRVWVGPLIVVQALLLVGVAGLALSGAAGTGWLGRVGLGIALLGRTSFLIGELWDFVQGRDVELLVPLGALTTGLGMLLAGIAILLTRRWGGWHRFIPLLAGLYPFIAMFPILAITGEAPLPMITLWGLLWLLLGLAMHAEASASGTLRRAASAYS